MVNRNDPPVQKRNLPKPGGLKYLYICKPQMNGEGKRTFDNPAAAIEYLERATGQPSFAKGRNKLAACVDEWRWIGKLQVIAQI